MAERTLDFTLTYGLDESYADKERDIAWRASLLDPEVNQLAEAGPGQGTPEQVAAAGTAAEPPSAIATGAQAAFQAAGEGARSAMEGLTRTVLTRPQGGANLADEVARGLADKAGGVRQFLMEGLMQVVSAPLIGLGAGARQALKNQRPDLEGAVLTPDGGFIRMVLGGGNPLEAGEDAKALRGPMTVGEALDLAVQQAPLALGGAAKVRQAAKIQGETLKGQRGSAGPPPDLGALEAAARKATEAVDALGPEPPKPSPESRAFGTTGRAGADPATVKAYDERVKAHSRWRRQFSKLKKLEVEASNAAFRAKRAVTREAEAEAAQFHGVELNLSDPDSIAAFVRQHGGVKPDPALAGEFARIPLDLKNTRGLPYDVIAEQGGVDGRALLDALTDMEFLRRQKRERDAAARQAEVDQWKGYEPTAEDVTLTSALDEWDRMMAESERDVDARAEAAGSRAAGEGLEPAPGAGPGPGQDPGGAGGSEAGGPVSGRGLPERVAAAPEGPPGAAPPARGDAGGVVPPGPSGPESRLNVNRVDASARVKALMTDLNQQVGGGRLAQHREVISHGQTMAEGAALSLDDILLADPARTPIEAGRAVQQGLRNYYNAVATRLERMTRTGAAPDDVLDAYALALFMAAQDERFGAGFARGLEARKIQSEAAAPAGGGGRKAARGRSAEGGLTQDNLLWLGEQLGVDPAVLQEQLAATRAAKEAQPATPAATPEGLLSRAAALRDAANLPETETLSVAELIAGKIGGELTLTTVAADLIRTAHGGRMPERVPIGEVIAAKIAAEWQAQLPVPPGPEAVLAVYNALNRAQRAGEDAQVRAGDDLAAAIASARVGAGQAARAARETSVAELVIANMRAQLELTRPSPDAILAALRALTRPQERSMLAQVWHGLRAGKDLFHEAWINALLSNPVTHVSNLTGTGLSTAWEIPERYTAEMVNRIFRQDPAGVQRGETASMLRSMIGALEDGIRLANQTWETGQASFDTGQVETHQVRARDYGFDPESRFGRALDVLGASLRSKAAPTRALLTEDAFYKGINYRMELSALALREGMLEGLEGPALERRVAALEAKPTPEMIAAAQDAATLRTLNKELGPAGQAFMMWANQIPGGRVVLPFIRTPTNIAKWTAQRTPALNLLSQQNWRDIQAGGAARDKAVARMALGSAVGAVLAWHVAQGTITGGGTGSRERKRLAEITGTRPAYALKIGDEWVKYGRGGDPLAGLVGVVADFVELASEIPDQEGLDEWAAHGEVLALALGQTFVNKTYMQGLSNVLEALKQPDRNTKQVALGLARSLVPAGVRQLARVSDDNIVREARSLVDAIKAGIPGLSQGIPAARNPITGEAIRTPAGWGPDMLSPALVTTNPRDPVIDEVLANKIDLAAVPWYVGGTLPDAGPQITEPRATAGLRLTPEEHDHWVTLMTEDVKDGRGRTLHGALTDLVASEKYQQQSTGPDGGRALLIKSLFQTYREQAKARLMDPTTGSPLLKRDLEATMRKRLEQRLPTTDPRSPQFTPGALLQSLGR